MFHNVCPEEIIDREILADTRLCVAWVIDGLLLGYWWVIDEPMQISLPDDEPSAAADKKPVFAPGLGRSWTRSCVLWIKPVGNSLTRAQPLGLNLWAFYLLDVNIVQHKLPFPLSLIDCYPFLSPIPNPQMWIELFALALALSPSLYLHVYR